MRPKPDARVTLGLVVGMLATHVILVGWLGLHQSPNVDETAHLAAGMATLQYGSFDVYCVNPPLMRGGRPARPPHAP